jgi:hypothetical protein
VAQRLPDRGAGFFRMGRMTTRSTPCRKRCATYLAIISWYGRHNPVSFATIGACRFPERHAVFWGWRWGSIENQSLFHAEKFLVFGTREFGWK